MSWEEGLQFVGVALLAFWSGVVSGGIAETQWVTKTDPAESIELSAKAHQKQMRAVMLRRGRAEDLNFLVEEWPITPAGVHAKIRCSVWNYEGPYGMSPTSFDSLLECQGTRYTFERQYGGTSECLCTSGPSR